MHPGVAASHAAFMKHYMQHREKAINRSMNVILYSQDGSTTPSEMMLSDAPAKFGQMFFVGQFYTLVQRQKTRRERAMRRLTNTQNGKLNKTSGNVVHHKYNT